MRNNILRLPFILLIVIFSLISCEKEDNDPLVQLSSAELLIQDIQSVMSSNNVGYIYCTELGVNFTTNVSIFGDYGKDYNFFGQTLYWEGSYYNMNRLKEYQIIPKNGIDYMVLFF